MELELGLKLERVADEFSSADFQIVKDRAGALFLSTETETMFILTAHLRGYRKSNINIEINEDGTRILVSGEKAVQETIMVGWKLQKKGTEIRGFKKGFKIPDGVILDKIRARFDDDESILTISMPKKEKGIRGVSIEEVKEPQLVRGNSETLKIDDRDFPPENIPKHERYRETEDAEYEPAGAKSPEIHQQNAFPEETEKKSIHDLKAQAEKETQPKDQRLQTPEGGIRTLPNEATQGLEKQIVESTGKAPILNENREGGEGGGGEEALAKAPERAPHEGSMEEKGRFRICTPIVAGSALLLSIVAFVIHVIRTKSQPGKRKD